MAANAANVGPRPPDMIFLADNRFIAGPIVESDRRRKKFAVFSSISQANIDTSPADRHAITVCKSPLETLGLPLKLLW